MCDLDRLFQNNRDWAARQLSNDPQYFIHLAQQQTPKFLWIGCSDSRVPANEIVGLAPGEVFVHRNIANLIVHSDLNCLSVLQYAIDVLRVQHVMVVGHYGCGGTRAVINLQSVGLSDNWLRHVHDIALKHADRLGELTDDERRADLLVELNVVEQVANVSRTSILQRAWKNGQSVEVHGLVYGLSDGILRRVGIPTQGDKKWGACYAESLRMLLSRS